MEALHRKRKWGLKTEGAVLALTGTETNIRAEALNIAAGGNVGSTEAALRTDISGNLDITAEDTIWLSQCGEAKVKNMTAKKGNVHLTAGSIPEYSGRKCCGHYGKRYSSEGRKRRYWQ